MIGATVAGTVAVLVALVDQGPWTALLMLGGVILVQQIEGHVLQPFLMGRFVSVHPLGVIVAIGCGVLVAGIAGALIAVPLAAALNAVVQHLAGHTEVGEDPEEALTEDVVEVGRRRRTAVEDRPCLRSRPICTGRRRGGRAGPARAWRSGPRWRGPAGCRRWPAARSGSSARTSSAPAPSSRAAPTCGSPGSPPHERAQRRRRGLRRQPRPGRRALGPAARHHARRSSCPTGAPIPKVNATRGYGAEVIFHGQYLDQAIVAAPSSTPSETGAVLHPPFDHVDIVAGQGTCGLEILEQAPEVQTVLVPTGGGGLLAGSRDRDQVAASRRPRGRASRPRARRRSRRRSPPGRPVQLESMRTMADGIAVGRPGDITFRAVQDYVDDVVTVSEDSLAKALLALHGARQAGRRAGRGGRRGGPDGRPHGVRHARRWRCSPAATSTRCCSAR